MKRSYIIALVIAACAAVWIVSGQITSENNTTDKPQTEQIANGYVKDKTLQTVRVRRFKAETIVQEVTLNGRTQASRDVTLKAEIDGQVTKIYRQKGDVVSQNDVIAELEIRDRAERVTESKEKLIQTEIEYNAAVSLENKGFNSKIRLAQAKANLEQAKANLKQAEVDLTKTKIHAPFDGVIEEQHIEIGDFVKSGDNIASVVDLSPIEVVAFVTERQVLNMKEGAVVDVKLLNGDNVKGTLSFISPTADPQTRTFRTETSIANPDYKIVEGLTTEIRIPVRERTAHKISPSIISLSDDGVIGVKYIDDSNIVGFKDIEILSDAPDHMWIGGLPDEVTLITVGQDFVTPGQKVDPKIVQSEGLL